MLHPVHDVSLRALLTLRSICLHLPKSLRHVHLQAPHEAGQPMLALRSVCIHLPETLLHVLLVALLALRNICFEIPEVGL